MGPFVIYKYKINRSLIGYQINIMLLDQKINELDPKELPITSDFLNADGWKFFHHSCYNIYVKYLKLKGFEVKVNMQRFRVGWQVMVLVKDQILASQDVYYINKVAEYDRVFEVAIPEMLDRLAKKQAEV